MIYIPRRGMYGIPKGFPDCVKSRRDFPMEFNKNIINFHGGE